MARLHSISAWVLTALSVLCTALFWRSGNRRAFGASRLLLLTVLLQGVIGYIQYFTGLPEGVVILHMAGLTLVTAAAAWLLFATTKRNAHVTQSDPEHRAVLRAS